MAQVFSKQKTSLSILKKQQSEIVLNGFCLKINFFKYVFFSKESQKETFFDILDRKEFFLDLKSQVLKKSKKSTFCKRASAWFLSKNRPFSYMFFFQQNKARNKTFLIFCIEKNCFLDLKSQVLKKSRKSTFCKGVSKWLLSKNRPFSYMCFFLAKKARNKQFLIFWIEKNAFQT